MSSLADHFIAAMRSADMSSDRCGPAGWMDARGDGNWAIGLRSADVHGNHASMYAGAVAGPIPGPSWRKPS